jgi:prolyl 4-hydroxylase
MQIYINNSNTVDLGDHEVKVLVQRTQPQVIVFGDLLTSPECRELIRISETKIQPSTAVDPLSGERRVYESRTSLGTSWARDATPLITRIENRISRLVGYENARTEGLHILNYPPGAEYRPHYDYFDPNSKGSAQHLAQGGNRIATLILYLNDVDQGGATVFPNIDLTVHPQQGSAVFFSYPNQEDRSLHGGAPVIQGSKWIATKWFKQTAF